MNLALYKTLSSIFHSRLMKHYTTQIHKAFKNDLSAKPGHQVPFSPEQKWQVWQAKEEWV